MKKHRTLMMGLIATAALSVAGLNTSVQAAGDEKVKLNGCLVKAEGDDDYLITNLPSEPGASTADRNPTTSAIGTTYACQRRVADLEAVRGRLRAGRFVAERLQQPANAP